MDRQGMTQQGPPRAFWLVRSDGGGGDDGDSGALAEGVLWADGVVAVRWCGQGTAVSVWSGGLEALLAGHGRDGSTEVRWSDEPTARTDEPVNEPTSLPGPYLPAPGVDGRCVRCGEFWPCLDCGF